MIDPEVQEAESLKYSLSMILLLPLGKGRYAVFDARRRLFKICWSPELPNILGQVPKPTARIETSRPFQSLDLNLDELGLDL